MPANRIRLAREHEKRRLKDIFSFVQIMQNAAAHRQHHRPMPRDERGKRGLVPFGDEGFEKLSVVFLRRTLGQSQGTDVPPDHGPLHLRHVLHAPMNCASINRVPVRREIGPKFFVIFHPMPFTDLQESDAP